MSNHAGQDSAGHRRQPRAGRGAGAGAGARPARASCWWRAQREPLDDVVAADPRRGRRGARHRRRRRATSDAIHAIAGQAAAAGRADRRADQQRQHAGAGAAAAAARHRVRGPRPRAGGQPGRPVPADQGGGRARWRCAGAGRSSTSAPTPRRGVPALGRLRRVEGGAGAARARSGRPSWRAPACASSPSTRARWTRGCTPTRCPTPTAPRWPIRRGRGAHRRAARRPSRGPARGRARRRPGRRGTRRRRRHEARDDVSARDATTCGCWSIDPRAGGAALPRRASRDLPDLLRRRRPPGGQRRRHAARVAARPRRRPGDAIERAWSPPRGDDRFSAVLFGAGDWRKRTEDRAAARRAAGRRAPALRRARRRDRRARSAASPRLVDAALRRRGRRALGGALPRRAARCSTRTSRTTCRCGHVQTAYAARPWAVEMPSAGRPLSWEILLGAAPQGRALASLTHARRAERDRRSGDRRRPAARRALRDPGGDRARRDRDARRAAAASSPSAPPWSARSRARRAKRRRPARRPRRDRPASSRPRSARASSTASCRAPTPPTRATSRCSPRSPAPRCSPRPPHHAERAGFLTHELGDSMLVLPGALAAAQPHPSATEPRANACSLPADPRLSDLQFIVGTPSSSPAQDNALSRHERGFESRWGREFLLLCRSVKR